MTNIQALVDGLSAGWQRERAASQMTLGKLIERLESLPPETPVGIYEPHSYRGYYTDLAFERSTEKVTAKDAIATCRAAMGEVFQGYKGGDYMMGKNTPVWIADYGCCGKKIVSINDDGELDLADEN